MNHRTNELNVHDIGEFTRFVEVVEATHFHGLSGDFVGDLNKMEFMNYNGIVVEETKWAFPVFLGVITVEDIHL